MNNSYLKYTIKISMQSKILSGNRMQKIPQLQLFDDGPNGEQMGAFESYQVDQKTIELYEEAEDIYYDYKFDKAEKKLRQVIDQSPAFPDAYFLLADLKMEAEDSIEAEKIIDMALKLFKSSIPSDYTGEIPWGITENRPFLSLMYQKLFFQKINENLEGAIDTGEQLLSRNPNDNHGVRWLMGDLHLLNSDQKEAARYLKENCAQYPPNRYSYAFLLYKQNKKWDAITQFRLAFIENIYISELLSNKAPVVPYEIDEFSNLNGLDTAFEYVNDMGYYWIQNSEVLNFMDLLKRHPIVITELNNTYSLLYELANVLPDQFEEFDFLEDPTEQNGGFSGSNNLYFETRKELIDEIEKIKKEIRTTSSKKILKELNELVGDI